MLCYVSLIPMNPSRVIDGISNKQKVDILTSLINVCQDLI